MNHLGQKALPTLIGALFFGTLIAIGYLTIFRGKEYALERGIHLPVILPTGEGLRVGTPVLVIGVEKGVISSLHYARLDHKGRPVPLTGDSPLKKNTDDSIPPAAALPFRAGERPAGQCVIAILDLAEDVEIHRNYRVITRFTTLISQKVVEIVPGNRRPGAPSWEPLKLDTSQVALFARTGRLPAEKENRSLMVAGNFDDPLYLLASFLNENRQSLRTITGNLASITTRIDRGNGTLAAIINSNTLHGETNDLLRELIILVNEIRGLQEARRESRAPIDFLEAYLLDILIVAGGGTL